MEASIRNMVNEISRILENCSPSIYLYGSSVLNDFRLGWSDIDILVLTRFKISEAQAQKLVTLRQAMLGCHPGNPYYRSFEGGMLTLNAFLSKETDRVVYWGTSGQRITNTYHFDSFSMVELLDHGILLCGEDVRGLLSSPAVAALYADVKKHYQSIREYAHLTGRSLYTFGWMLDIARFIYTLRTGKVIAKTAAGFWALENNLCPDPDALQFTLTVRQDPMKYRSDDQAMDYAEALAGPVCRFADVLGEELVKVSPARQENDA